MQHYRVERLARIRELILRKPRGISSSVQRQNRPSVRSDVGLCVRAHDVGVVRLGDARVLLLLSVPILPARVHVFQGLPALSNRLRRPDPVHGEVTALVEMRNLLRAEDSPAVRLGQCQLGLLPADRVAVRSWKEAVVVASPAGGTGVPQEL